MEDLYINKEILEQINTHYHLFDSESDDMFGWDEVYPE